MINKKRKPTPVRKSTIKGNTNPKPLNLRPASRAQEEKGHPTNKSM